MSVSFSGYSGKVQVGGSKEEHVPCLCSQFAPTWAYPMNPSVDFDDLKAHANPKCPFCFGLGLELVTEPGLDFNLSNATAARFFQAINVTGEDVYGGELPLEVLLTALDSARANLATRLYESEATDPYSVTRGAKGCRVITQSRTTEEMAELFERFQGFVDACLGEGADRITWG